MGERGVGLACMLMKVSCRYVGRSMLIFLPECVDLWRVTINVGMTAAFIINLSLSPSVSTSKVFTKDCVKTLEVAKDSPSRGHRQRIPSARGRLSVSTSVQYRLFSMIQDQSQSRALFAFPGQNLLFLNNI